MQVDLSKLDPNALNAMLELKRYRGGEKMADVWPLIDDYTPADQREDARRMLCNAVIDMAIAAEKSPHPGATR